MCKYRLSNAVLLSYVIDARFLRGFCRRWSRSCSCCARRPLAATGRSSSTTTASGSSAASGAAAAAGTAPSASSGCGTVWASPRWWTRAGRTRSLSTRPMTASRSSAPRAPSEPIGSRRCRRCASPTAASSRTSVSLAFAESATDRRVFDGSWNLCDGSWNLWRVVKFVTDGSWNL